MTEASFGLEASPNDPLDHQATGRGHSEGDQDGSRRSQLTFVGGTALGALLIMVAIGRRSLALDFYFDEMWRYDMVRDANPRARALLHDTPIPPGWLYAMHYVLAPLTSSRSLARLATLVPSAIGLAVLADALRMVAQRAGAIRQQAGLIGALSVWLACGIPAIAAVNLYFNNYGTEILAGALLIWAAARVELRGASATLLLALAVTIPLFAHGALLMLPAILVLWYRGQVTVSARSAIIAGAAAVTTSLVSWMLFYRPLPEGELVDFWSSEKVGAGGGWPFVRHFSRQLSDALVPSGGDGVGIWLLVVVVVALTAGAIIVARSCPSLLVFVAVGQTGAIGASIVLSWPATPVRVNIAFVAPIATLIPFGALMLIRRSLHSRVHATTLIPIAVITAFAFAAPQMWPTSTSNNATSTATFARGLTNDLQLLASRSGSHVVVVAYHPMSHWYADDVFRHNPPHQMDVDILRDSSDGAVYSDIDRLVGELLRPGTDVWCIIPYEVGPENSQQACRLTLPTLTETYRVRMGRALAIGFRADG